MGQFTSFPPSQRVRFTPSADIRANGAMSPQGRARKLPKSQVLAMHCASFGKAKACFSDDLGEIGYCHCDNCQRSSGSMFSCNAAVPDGSFRLKSGENAIKGYESSPGVVRSFGSNCGSPVFAKTARDPGHIRVRLGTLQPHAKVKPVVHWFIRFKPNWYKITDGLPQYE